MAQLSLGNSDKALKISAFTQRAPPPWIPLSQNMTVELRLLLLNHQNNFASHKKYLTAWGIGGLVPILGDGSGHTGTSVVVVLCAVVVVAPSSLNSWC